MYSTALQYSTTVGKQVGWLRPSGRDQETKRPRNQETKKRTDEPTNRQRQWRRQHPSSTPSPKHQRAPSAVPHRSSASRLPARLPFHGKHVPAPPYYLLCTKKQSTWSCNLTPRSPRQPQPPCCLQLPCWTSQSSWPGRESTFSTLS